MSESIEALKTVLKELGVEDIEKMTPEEVVGIAMTLGIEVPESALSEATATDNTEQQPSDSMLVDTSTELNTAFLSDQSHLNMTMPEVDMTPQMMEETTPAAEGDSSHDDTISAFCSITGSDPTSAGHFLEAFGWNLEGAIPAYLENAGNNSTTTPPSRSREERLPGMSSVGISNGDFNAGIRRSMPGIGGADNDISMPPMPGVFGTAFDHQEHISSVLDSMMRSSMRGMQAGNDSDDEMDPGGLMAGGVNMPDFMAAYQRAQQGGGGGGGRQDLYDEEGIRLPDPVQRQRLVPTGPSMVFGGGSRGSGRDDGLGRAEDPSVEWMFPPPRHLSSQLTLDQARTEAQKEGRWILVNIQTHEEFASHMLNRDTWVHETIESILRTSFLFWQRGHTCGDGAAYIRMHRLTDDDLPHIGIIDPRTGAKLLTLTGFISPDDLCIRLVEFAERHTAPFGTNHETPVTRSKAGSIDVSAAASETNSGNTSSANLSSLDGGKPGASDSPGPSTGTSRSSTGLGGITTDTGTMNESTVGLGGGVGIAGRTDNIGSNTTAVAGGEGKGPSLICDYGPVPEEPAENEDGVIKISIKLSNGKAIARRYYKTNTVNVLFAVAASQENELSNRNFDLVTRFPMLSLLPSRNQTLEEFPLAGSQVLVKFL